MTRRSFHAVLAFAAPAFVAFAWFSAASVAQDKEDMQENLTKSLDRAFESDDLEFLPEQKRLLIKGYVNGSPAVFKIDSGAIGTLLTLKSAKERGLRVIDFNKSFVGAGGSGKIYGSPVKRLQLGMSIDLANQRLMVIDLPSLEGIDGLIGVDTLTSTKAIIDYRHRKLRVPGKKSAESLERIATDAGMNVEKLERDGNYIYATLNHGDESLRMLIDTGAQKTVIGAAAADRSKLTVQETADRVIGAGVDAPKVRKTSIDRLALGRTSFLKFECVVMPLEFLGSYSRKPIDGILGADALARSNSILSIADAVIVIRPGAVDMAPENTNRKP